MSERMKIEPHQITIRELVDGYKNNDEEGVVAYHGKLNVRPKYQREFVYKPKERNAVIDTVLKGYPLNIMYWSVQEDGTYELMDGQQRTVSICEYYVGNFAFEERYYSGLEDEEKERFLNYPITIYFCKGSIPEKLKWFETINIAGEPLSDQELRNAMNTGPWLTSAKISFSKTNCRAKGLADKYINVKVNRQELLELALSWIIDRDKVDSDGQPLTIMKYMNLHRHDDNADELWFYFRNVIDWVETKFSHYYKQMKGLPWGIYYNKYKDKPLDAKSVNAKVADLMKDYDVTNKKGIFEYILDGKEKHLNIREFQEPEREYAYARQKGCCAKCGKHFPIEEMQADHIKPWSLGGKTVKENCQMLCAECNATKSDKY